MPSNAHIAPRPYLWATAAALLVLALILCASPAPASGADASASAKRGADGAKRGEGGRGKARRRAAGRARRGSARRGRSARQRRRLAHRRRMRRLRRNARTRLSDNVSLARRQRRPRADGSSSGVIDAGFENGLFNWNTAGVGDVIPAVTGDLVRSGIGSGRVVLTGGQERSELILGGDGGRSADDAILFHEGAEAYYAFSFLIETMVYGRPGAHNVIMQLKGDDSGSPNLGLQLWDYEGDDGESGGRGLWSHGDAMGGDRFLAPVPEGQWHDVVVHFRASGSGAGLYEVFLDGQLVDSRSGVDTIPSGASHIYVKNGIYRNPGEIPGTSVMRLDAAKLGPSLASVLPG